MSINPKSKLQKVEVNILSRVVTMYSDNGEVLSVENNTSDEFTRMCEFLNTHEDLTEDMIEYVY
jgi:hypothetical protein